MWLLVFTVILTKKKQQKKNYSYSFKCLFALQIFISNLVENLHNDLFLILNMYLQTVLRLHSGTLVVMIILLIICVFPALETEKCSVFTPAVVGGIHMFSNMAGLWLYKCTHTFSLHKSLTATADVENKRTSNPLQCPHLHPRVKKETQAHEVSDVSLPGSLFEWLHPVCGLIFFFSTGASDKTRRDKDAVRTTDL